MKKTMGLSFSMLIALLIVGLSTAAISGWRDYCSYGHCKKAMGHMLQACLYHGRGTGDFLVFRPDGSGECRCRCGLVMPFQSSEDGVEVDPNKPIHICPIGLCPDPKNVRYCAEKTHSEYLLPNHRQNDESCRCKCPETATNHSEL